MSLLPETAILKGVCCEKPLAWSIDECLELGRMAKKMKVPAQMGNQGNAWHGWRDCYDIVHSDVIETFHSIPIPIAIPPEVGDRPAIPRSVPQTTMGWDRW